MDIKTNTFYTTLKDLHGYGSVKSLGWTNRESQEIRFKVLTEIGFMGNKTILDAGCGYGDLCQYLMNKNINFKKYVGIDMNAQFIDYAKKRECFNLKGFAGKIDFIEVETSNYRDVSDYVIASGLFSIKYPDVETMRQLYDICKCGVGINFLTKYGKEGVSDDLCRVFPVDVIKIVEQITKTFVVRHDYKQNDFTVYIYKYTN